MTLRRSEKPFLQHGCRRCGQAIASVHLSVAQSVCPKMASSRLAKMFTDFIIQHKQKMNIILLGHLLTWYKSRQFFSPVLQLLPISILVAPPLLNSYTKVSIWFFLWWPVAPWRQNKKREYTLVSWPDPSYKEEGSGRVPIFNTGMLVWLLVDVKWWHGAH